MSDFIDGTGDGSGDGYGSGYGYGYGSGSGYGDGDGSGYGSGYGDDIKSFNNKPIHIIDGVQTIINSVHNNCAKGFILQDDLTLKPCYVAKVGNCFAHGETLKQATQDANNKYLQSKSVEERIEEFCQKFNSKKMYPAIEFYEWHGILTGSCRMGRDNFCREHGIKMDTKYTIKEFIALTKNAYGGNIIKRIIT